jgi:hypothetical protein
MAGNTSSSASARSQGYVSSVSADNVTANPTIVNVYVDSNSSTSYSPISSAQPNQVNFETSPGITTPLKKLNQYVSTTPTSTGKYDFDSLTPTVASTTTSYQKVGSAVQLTKQNNSGTTAVKYLDVVKTVPSFSEKPSVTSTNKQGFTIPAAPQHPGEYQWNLPPHRWSMPRTAYSDPNNMPAGSGKSPSDDRYRRGRIWWKASDTSLSTVNSKGKTVKIDNADRKYGFQFLWNPTSFSTAVSVQMDATPNANDRFLSTVGAFPSTEAISFTLEINRINDFACANAYFKRPTNIGSSLGGGSTNSFISRNDAGKFISYYQGNGSFAAATAAANMSGYATVEDKLIDLYQRGTLADIEYLYMAINGPGPGGSASAADHWKNGRGIITADIGFLMPTLLNIDVGPLSYIGYVTSMGVNHTMFTQDMIPIQSTVQISFNLLATAGLATNTTGG